MGNEIEIHEAIEVCRMTPCLLSLYLVICAEQILSDTFSLSL